VKTLSRKTTVWLWIIAVVITLASAVYQRMTGPTYPVRGHVQIGTDMIRYKLLRSGNVTEDAVVTFEGASATTSGDLRWKRLRSTDEWLTVPLQRRNGNLVAVIPWQPASGKVAYQTALWGSDGQRVALTPEPVVIRFKGRVPGFVLHPHILFMFLSMLFSTRAGLEALARGKRARRLAWWTAWMLLAGGIILGPFVQKYAFGTYWSGWPFGHDLTDNKTAFAMLFWIVALWRSRDNKDARGWFITAAVVQFLVFMIPHSVLGSEMDFTKKG
jgi:hypothetical protein